VRRTETAALGPNLVQPYIGSEYVLGKRQPTNVVIYNALSGLCPMSQSKSPRTKARNAIQHPHGRKRPVHGQLRSNRVQKLLAIDIRRPVRLPSSTDDETAIRHGRYETVEPATRSIRPPPQAL